MFELVPLALLTGFILSFGFGSVFFALIQTSIDYGYKAGRNIAFGVVIGDFLLVTFALLGTNFLPSVANFESYVRIVAATLLFGLGFAQFRKVRLTKAATNYSVKKKVYFIAKGFVLNIVNPVNFFAWVIISSTLKTYNYSLREEVLFLSICIGTVFLSETLIAYFADRVREKLSDQIIIYIKYLTGCIFFGLGSKFLFDFFQS